MRTDYVDILYVHWWDFNTSPAELMSALNVIIQQGKVLYPGTSNTPAWFVVKCNEYAHQHNIWPSLSTQVDGTPPIEGWNKRSWTCAQLRTWLWHLGALGGGMFKTPEPAEAKPRKLGAMSIRRNSQPVKLWLLY
jgi:aryl-alcohol dehydrogenase-like predicted oxidoreductase